jgi:hypothetical protein
MAALDPGALVAQIEAAMTAKVGQDVTALEGFASEQLNQIAQEAATIAAGALDGSITGDNQTFLLGNLAEETRSFVNTLAGLAVVSAEEVWNAAVGVIWAAINKATGLALTVP